MKIVTSFYMLDEKQFLQRKLSHSISSPGKIFPNIAKFIRKWFLLQYTYESFKRNWAAQFEQKVS